MAVETVKQITQPPEFIEAEAKLYLDQLRPAIAGIKGADLSKVYGPQYVAGMDPLTKQAMGQASGLGSYQPFLQQAEALTGPTAYQQYMSPYQQDVIDTTLKEFDIQTQKGLPGLAQQAITAGAFGGGREGVQRAEYLSSADRNRAALQAQLLQQGFGQAQNLAQQDYLRNIQLAQQSPALAGQQISALTTLGGLGQAQQQAELSAQQQLAQQQFQQPLQAAQQYGAGITSLISGYPGQQTVGQTPVPGIAQTAIGAGTTLAGIYGAMNR
jgi:hypothetical protein